MGLAERLKAIETSQSPVNTQVQQQVTNVPAHQPPTNIPPTNVPEQYPSQQPPAQYVAASAPPLPNTQQFSQPNYQFNNAYDQYPQNQPIQYNQNSTQYVQDYNYQQPSVQPVKKETGFFATLTNKFMPKPTTQVSYDTPGPYYNAIKPRIDAVIQDKNLHFFYPLNSPRYNALLNRVSHVDFPSIAAKRRIPLELAFDFAALAVADVVYFVDDSGSINFDEQWNPSTEKLDDLKLILSRNADIASLFDDDGMSIRFFNCNHEFDNITSEQDAMNALAKVQPNGGTPLGRNLLSKVLEPFVYAKARKNQLTKPVMIYIITDGVPDNKAEVKDNIRRCKEWLEQTSYGKSAVSIMFAQVGTSQSAALYLKQELDNDPQIGDDVDTTGNFEMEYEKYKAKGVDLTPDLWLLQMTLGSLVRAYDEGND
jgi:hypothetical protein